MPRTRNKDLIIAALTLTLLFCWLQYGRAEDNIPEDSASIIQAQDSSDIIISGDSTSAIMPVDSLSVPADSERQDTVIIDPVLYNPGGDKMLMDIYYSRDTSRAGGQSPTTALFKSVLFPGWGQFSNRRYIKAGLVFVVESYFIYKAVDYGRKASDWRQKWKDAPTDLKSAYFSKYADYRDSRNSNLWYTALTIFLSMFDAYVDAHLRNFPDDVSERQGVSMDVIPGGKSTLSLSYNF